MTRHPLVRSSLGLFVALAALAPDAMAQRSPFVRVRDGVDVPVEVHRAGGSPSLGGPVDPCGCAIVAGFGLRAPVRHGQAVPGGGTLSPIAFANPGLINESGDVACIAFVDGALRNQGVFFADQNDVLTPIAMGCGGGGGSGD